MVTEKVRKYIKAIRRRFGIPSRVERLMENAGISKEEAEAFIRRRELAQGHVLEKGKWVTPTQAQSVPESESTRVQVKSKGEGMTPGMRFNERRVISMATFVVAVYFAVAAYIPGNGRWGGGAHLSPGHVAAAAGFLCVTYLLWPKRQGPATSQQAEQDVGLVLKSGFARLNALDPLSETYTDDSIGIWKEMLDAIVPQYAKRVVNEALSAIGRK